MSDMDAFFLSLLDTELRKVRVLYDIEEQRLTDDLAALQTDIERQKGSGPYAGHRYLDEEADEEAATFSYRASPPPLSKTQTGSLNRRRYPRWVSRAGPKGICVASRIVLYPPSAFF